MALTSTMHRFRLELSDVDRGVYETLDLRAAQHPSESATWLVTRVLAYALEYEADLVFGKGISDAEEPALWVRDPTGAVQLWLDLGQPSAERLHKAAKRATRLMVYCLREPKALATELVAAKVHHVDQIELVSLPTEMVARLVELLDRNNVWSILRTEGLVYVTVGDETVEGTPRRMLASDAT